MRQTFTQGQVDSKHACLRQLGEHEQAAHTGVVIAAVLTGNHSAER